MKIGTIVGGIVGFLGTILLASLFFGSWYTIDETQRGVLLRNGAIVSETAIDPGLHFKMPIWEDVDAISVAFQSATFENMESYSADQQVAHFKVSVNYHVPTDKVVTVRREYIDLATLERRVLERFVPDVLKKVFGTYKAPNAINNRTQLGIDIKEALKTAVVNQPLVIDSLQIEDIKFSEVYEKSIEEKQLAEVAVQKLQNEKLQADVNAQITVVNAQAEADANLARKTAEAEGIKVMGLAEAAAIEARGKALRDNPALVTLVAAEKWDGKLPTTMPPNGTVPFITVPSPQSSLTN